MILSIIIISHNQCELLRRCIDSVLAQSIPFAYEVIVSDDSSTDGTWELIKEYEFEYPAIVKGYQCCSNDCNPANTSQRSGWNRCNAYPHASGKYIAHVDADDYFRPGADVYARQVDMLEKHPECYLCLSNILKVKDGEPLSNARPWYKDGALTEERIISGADFIRDHMFILNQAFVQRRNPYVDPIALYGKRYVDSVITFHHLQFGDIVCVDACDYVHVQYNNSVTGIMSHTHDTDILWCLGLYIPALIPFWRHDYYLAEYSSIKRVVQLSRAGYKLQDNNRKSLDGLGMYIYNTFNRRLNLYDNIRLAIAEQYLRVMHRFGWNKKINTAIMHLLICR